MKIGILTHYLHYGYGGVIQNYALQTVLKSLGHDAVTLRCAYNKKVGIKLRIRSWLSMIAHIILRIDTRSITAKQDVFVTKEVEPFIREYINVTRENNSTSSFRRATIEEKCDALVVGSDQIWRRGFPYVKECYLNFAQDLNVKKVAYAASFSQDEWEYDNEFTKVCKKLAERFDAISVREKSAVNLCKKYFGVDADFVLDPTLLLEKEDYIELYKKNEVKREDGDLFTYVLDKTGDKEAIINMISVKLGKKRYECMPQYSTTYFNIKNHPNECVYPPITQWLRSINEAELVVTDSFHGMVFCIIFNRPFFVLVNEDRGAARFYSLLKLFGLESRIINKIDDVDVISPIDWYSVNQIKKEWKEKSISFLKKALLY
jgi:hypothetical protein